jgi:hypothetical protein
MSEPRDFDLDQAVNRAWSSFAHRLADHLAAMDEDDLLVVDVETAVPPSDGAAPYAQFCAWGEESLRAEISSNSYLAPEHRLDDAVAAQLVRLGWHPPSHGKTETADGGSANFYLDASRRDADRVAAMAVAALRDVFGVTHPAFLVVPDLELFDALPVEPIGSDAPDEPDEPVALVAESLEHLRVAVDAAITPADGPALVHDDQGDIPIPFGSAVVFVRVHESAPVVELFSCVVEDVEDRERAAIEVAVLNREHPLVKFLLVEDVVVAMIVLPALPFAPRHLRALLPLMGEIIDRVDDGLVARVGGRRALEPTDDDDVAEPPRSSGRTGRRSRPAPRQTSLFGEGDVPGTPAQGELFDAPGDDL